MEVAQQPHMMDCFHFFLRSCSPGLLIFYIYIHQTSLGSPVFHLGKAFWEGSHNSYGRLSCISIVLAHKEGSRPLE